MPFDGRLVEPAQAWPVEAQPRQVQPRQAQPNQREQTGSPLQLAAAKLGLRGISPAILDQHKQEQVARYGPHGNFAYRHNKALFIANSVLMIGGLASIYLSLVLMLTKLMMSEKTYVWALNFNLSPMSLMIASCGMFVMTAVLFHGVVLRGPAHWVEYILTWTWAPRSSMRHFPEPVSRIATALQQALQTSGHQGKRFPFVYGELRQDNRILDPYLTLRDVVTGEQLIIGIWIDDTVLHLAHQETP